MPIDREKTLQAAQKYVEKKRYDRAIAEYQRIVQEDPNDARTLLKIGDLQARLQAYPEAIATYDRVGQYYSSQGFALKAIAVFKQIRELIKKHAPELADRYAHIAPKLAEIYEQLGLAGDALSAYDEVAAGLQRAGRDREAIDIFRKMVSLDSGNPLPHLRLAEACCRVQSLDLAVDSFWTAAELLMSLGRRDDALKVVERILHFRVDARFARLAAELYLQRGTREDGLQALAKLQICFQADPKNLDMLGLLAQAFTIIGQEGKAIEVYKEMARIAREQDRGDLLAELLAHLRSVAPHDEQVRALASLAPISVPAEGAESLGRISVDDGDVELIDEAPTSNSLRPVPPRAKKLVSPRLILASAPDVVVVDDEVEAAEEFGDPGSFDAPAHAKKALVDAESFRKLKLYPKAIEALHIALEIEPRSLGIRQKLREILVESGDREGAIAETLNMAELEIERNDLEQAEALVYEVLEIEPEHTNALALLHQIMPGANETGAAEAQRGRTLTLVPPEEVDGYDASAPLPAYDLEDGLSERPPPAPAARASLAAEFDVTDDPFGAPTSNRDTGRQLPRFPSEPAAAGSVPPAARIEVFEDIEEIAAIDAEAPAPAAAASAGEGLEDLLDEADFFTTRGLYDDAKAILVEQLTRTPHHPLVLERLREVESAVGASGESRTIERSQLGRSQPAEAGFDVGASLGALDDMDEKPLTAPGARAAPGREVDVDQVFEKFKAGIRAQVSETDSSTHYDLGVAYKEMGLIAEAVHEFELSARDPARECMCFAMIGMIHLEQNQLDRAAESYMQALNAPSKTPEQEMNLFYDLGNVHEMKGNEQEALFYFQKVSLRDPDYRDVADRLASLTRIEGAAPVASSARAVNDKDDFDGVFDDMFENKG